VPPLRYDIVFQLKRDFTALEIILNGGVTSLDQAKALLKNVDGVMLGREVYQKPYLLADVDNRIFGASYDPVSREQILMLLIPYIQQELKGEVRLNSITRHILGLFHGMPGARGWRRYLSDHVGKSGADENVLLEALKLTNQ
jgi:tRNA-dihydrouridine synthase A